MMNSARMLRAELPVQRKSSLNFGFTGSILAAGFFTDGLIDPAGAFFDFRQTDEVGAKLFVGCHAVLKTLQVGFQFVRKTLWEAVNDPCSLAGRLHHLSLAEVGEMLGNLYLGELKDVLKMANAQRPVRQKMDDAKAVGVAEALVNLNEVHVRNIYTFLYIRKSLYFDLPKSNGRIRCCFRDAFPIPPLRGGDGRWRSWSRSLRRSI